MNRIEELELCLQMLIDSGASALSIQGTDEARSLMETRLETAEHILLGWPCNCNQFPFPHKRNRECFRRYSAPSA